MTNLIEFAEKEKQRLDEQREEAMAEAGYVAFYKIPEGTTKVTFSTDVEPREDVKFGGTIFRVTVNGEEKDLRINPRSPLYREVIANLAEHKVDMTITRMGTGMTDTRYKVTA
jgi:hypothetical protein